MGYKKFEHDVGKAAQEWESFFTTHAALVTDAGIPVECLEKPESWDYLLQNGTGVIDELAEDQYAALVELVESYFALGYEFYRPTALRIESQEWLDLKFLT